MSYIKINKEKELSPLDELRQIEIDTKIPINETKVINYILQASNSTSSVLEAKTEKELNNFSSFDSKVKEFINSQTKEKNERKYNSNILSLSFFSRSLVKNPNIKDKELKKIKDLNGKIKDEISKVFQNGTTPSETAKLKKSLMNLDISDKYIDDKLTILSVDNDLDKLGVDTVDLECGILPYYTYEESNELRNNEVQTVNGFSYKEWKECYSLLSNGIIPETYNDIFPKWIDTIQELYSDKESNRNKIYALGWNPDIEFTFENRRVASKRFKSIIELYNNILDISNYDIIDETINENESFIEKTPVYIVVTYTKSAFGKATRAITHAKYTHSGFSLDHKLNKIYSYNMSTKGFSIEDINTYNKDKGCIMCLYCIMVDKLQMKKIKFYLDEQLANIANSKYSLPNLLGILSNKAVHISNAMVCSQFTDSVLKKAGIDITKKDSALVTPQDFRNSKSKHLIKLYEGEIKKFNPNKVLNKLQSYFNKYPIKESYIEEKVLPVRFDDSGNLLISNMKKLDFDQEYYKCHRLLVNYEKTNDIEGIKYELSKLWFMNCVIEERLYGKKNIKDREELFKSRAKILNDFSKYSQYVTSKEKNFNFNKYYENTPFSDTLTIDKHTIKHTSNAVKNLAKLLLK